MRRFLVTLCLLVGASLTFGQEAASGPLEKARAYFGEKSWQLAVQTVDQANTVTLSADANRELLYIKAMGLAELHKVGEATAVLGQLIKSGETDAWAGRAHWRLQPGLTQHRWLNPSQDNALAELRAADRILTDLKTPDLRDFYMDVINSQLPNQYFPKPEDRDYILSFFDKIVPLLSGAEELIAGVQLKRQAALNVQKSERTPEERLSGLRGIVAEFPKSRAAAEAQLQVAQYYIQKREFAPAVYELSMLANQYAGSEEAKIATKEIAAIKRAEAVFSLPGQFLPGEKITFQLTARNTSEVKLSAVPIDIMAELQKKQNVQPDLQAVSGKPVHTDSISVDDNDDFLPTTRSVTLDFNRPGAYVLRAEVEGKITCNALLLISDLVLVGNTGPAGYEFWVVDAKTGKPRANASIAVAHNIQTDNKWITGQQVRFFADYSKVNTDSNGFADFKQPNNTNGMLAVATAGDHVALLDNIYWSPFNVHQESQPMVYLYTDRPVYRPDQKVYWRAIIRNRDSGEYRLPAGTKYQVTVRDPQGQEILQKKDLALSEFGTVDGEVALAADAPLGQYNVEIWDQSLNQPVGHGNFRIEEYKKPEFEVSVESVEDFGKVGQPVKAKVAATYLFGSPVSDATVKYTVRRRPRFQIFWENLRWYIDDEDLGWFEDAPERPPTMHGSGGTIVTQGEGKLDANGEFTLSFDSTVPDEELKQADMQRPMGGFGRHRMIWPPVPSTWDFQVEVTVTDASRRNIDGSQVIPVGLKALKLAAKTGRQIVVPGDNARVELKSLNLADKPVPSSGTLYIEKLVWNEGEEEDDVTTISEQGVAIESSGSLVIDWRVPGDVHGRLRFAYITDDPFGGKSVAYADFFAASPDDTDVAARYQGVEIVTDKTRYTVGETARIMILSEYKDAVAWYWEDTGSGNLRKQVLPLPHRTNFVTIPISEAHVPNSQIHIVAVRDKQIIMDDVELIVPPTSRVLKVEVLPVQGQVEPGETGQVVIKATDMDGKPVSVELSLSVFDEAITYIAPDMRPDIRKTFYGMKRPLRSDVRSSINVSGSYGGPLLPEPMQYLSWDENHVALYAEGGAVRQLSERRSGRMELAADMGVPASAPAPMYAMSKATADTGVAGQMMVAQDKAWDFDATEKKKEVEQPAIRADFRDSMFWSPTVRTDASGSATIDIKYPDSLTTWRMVAVGTTPETRVGNGTTETIARKKVLARLQAPRFFRERDEVVISANLHNYTDAEIAMEATLRVHGVTLENATSMPLQGNGKFSGATQNVTITAGGEKRVDWNVKVDSAAEGEAVLNLMALSSAGSDAMQTTVPLLPHGIDKFVAWNGTSHDESTTGVTIEATDTSRSVNQMVSLPNERIKETSRLEIQVNPSLASSIRDAIPYMIEYPYGCVEQTMSRFMPAAVAARAFQVLGYPLDKSIQEKLPKVTDEGLKRLRDMQLPSGGWGWWANDSENLYMTAYAMYGLTLCRDAEVAVDPAIFDRGLRRLAELRDDTTSKVIEQDRDRAGYWYPNNFHNLMFAEYVMTLNGQSSKRTVDHLWSKRDDLSAYGLAMMARTMIKIDRKEEAEIALRNMVNVAVVTPENNTLRWGRIDGAWHWYDDAVEATAVGMMAYLEIHPDDPAVDQAMKWLVLNRQGGRWKSTRDTAQAVLALTQYMLQRKEAATPVKIEVLVGDRLVKTLDVNPKNFWDFDGRIVLRGSEIPDGEFPVTLRINGESKVYYSVFAEYFTLEEDIAKAGNEIYVTRSYEKLDREQTTETVNGKPSVIFKDKWLPLNDGEAIKSGDELRVTLKIKSLNDYEYLVFEDPKPAGMEPVDLQSGSKYGNGLCSNMELRDKWVAFFMTTLRQGEHTISYNVRAEIPGTFHTMPTTGYAMYFPPLRANSDENVMKVTD